MPPRKSPSRSRALSKPAYVPSEPNVKGKPLTPLIDQGHIWCPLKSDWRVDTPEERVRQALILRFKHVYGYDFGQMDQERRTMHGHRSPKADIVVWESPAAKSANASPVLVAETKSDNVVIVPQDHSQGESYGRAVGAKVLVLHNSSETRVFSLTPGLPGDRVELTVIPKATELSEEKLSSRLAQATKPFSRDEFRRMLFECHSIIRDNHKLEPGRAFDEISKILFIKMYVERIGAAQRFTREFVREYAKMRGDRQDQVMDDLFEDTKSHFKSDDLFQKDDKITISLPSFTRIVELLEKFDLSATSDDVKGIAFERFLGSTFRGNLGQFFTPRIIVDFMVEVLDPKEDDLVCDPASGSGGFLIKAFEHMRSKVELDIERQKDAIRAKIDKRFEERYGERDLSDEETDERERELEEAFAPLNHELDPQELGSRMYRIAHERLFGTDAEARAARTSKMNMIMHGDGHGGIHHHDGLVDVNGIFPGRFDLVITNPPFGLDVGKEQIIGQTIQTRVATDSAIVAEYTEKYGPGYAAAHARLEKAAVNQEPVLKLFEVGRIPVGGAEESPVRKSRPGEVLFVERCLQLLRPGGRVGIVLPDGILNNPSLQWLRDFAESRARLLGIVSLPMEVFAGADATVKTSIAFLQRFTSEDDAQWADALARAAGDVSGQFDEQIRAVKAELEPRIACFDSKRIAAAQRQLATAQEQRDRSATKSAKEALAALLTTDAKQKRSRLERELRARLKPIEARREAAIRQRAKELFDYPIFMAEIPGEAINAGAEGQSAISALAAQFREFLAAPESYEPPEAEMAADGPPYPSSIDEAVGV